MDAPTAREITPEDAQYLVDVARTAVDELAAAVATGTPLERLRAACVLGRWAALSRDQLARDCIARGASFAEVGRLVGVSREAARQRYPRT